MSVRILHTADWQIGKQFANVPGDAGAALRTQRLVTIAKLAELAVTRAVDVVLVAGDVFDDNAVSDDTLRRTINAMSAYSGPWVLLPGNHDSGLTQSAWSRLRKLAIVPGNVILADQPEAIDLVDGKLQILPAPLQRRQEVRDLTDWFDRHESAAGVFRVGIAHGSVTNRLPESAETHNPISDTRAQSAQLDYLALGDWHGTLHIAEKTWYSGTPEQDRFRQNAPGNVLLVDISDPGSSPDVEVVSVGRFFWHQLEFTITDDDSLAVLDNRLQELGEDAPGVVLRMRLVGAITLATGQALNALLDKWHARYHFLQVDDSALAAQPSSEDISEMAATGFLKEAISAIVAVEENPDDPDQPYASRALQILYLTQKELAR
jgi:DNA repair exonuclease SbcCD nuclease subunit